MNDKEKVTKDGLRAEKNSLEELEAKYTTGEEAEEFDTKMRRFFVKGLKEQKGMSYEELYEQLKNLMGEEVKARRLTAKEGNERLRKTMRLYEEV